MKTIRAVNYLMYLLIGFTCVYINKINLFPLKNILLVNGKVMYILLVKLPLLAFRITFIFAIRDWVLSQGLS